MSTPPIPSRSVAHFTFTMYVHSNLRLADKLQDVAKRVFSAIRHILKLNDARPRTYNDVCKLNLITTAATDTNLTAYLL